MVYDAIMIIIDIVNGMFSNKTYTIEVSSRGDYIEFNCDW